MHARTRVSATPSQREKPGHVPLVCFTEGSANNSIACGRNLYHLGGCSAIQFFSVFAPQSSLGSFLSLRIKLPLLKHLQATAGSQRLGFTTKVNRWHELAARTVPTRLARTAIRAGKISIARVNLLLRAPSGDCSIPTRDVSTPHYQLQIVRFVAVRQRDHSIRSPRGVGLLNSPFCPTSACFHRVGKSIDLHFALSLIFFLAEFEAVSQQSLPRRANVGRFY